MVVVNRVVGLVIISSSANSYLTGFDAVPVIIKGGGAKKGERGGACRVLSSIFLLDTGYFSYK